MKGYEEKNWEILKEELTTEWERLDLDGRYSTESLDNIFSNAKRAGGISKLTDYNRCVSEYENITNYMGKYEYIIREFENNEELYSSISPEIMTSIIRKRRRDKVRIQERDGGYIVPEIKVLKSCIKEKL
ncbi:hypothetical protein O181_030601 [Austropuccinia psidii MF-1]|uniref:Uncharacterized protein n=1 Tax=Austropuccinia psidii MF-1 TaxID=1389203 RepID=A0A9Q3H4E6_9BASI|nr:hypothetical protein [Austropuccinia psidii MF-1]